jgi:hypothetical protein
MFCVNFFQKGEFMVNSCLLFSDLIAEAQTRYRIYATWIDPEEGIPDLAEIGEVIIPPYCTNNDYAATIAVKDDFFCVNYRDLIPSAQERFRYALASHGWFDPNEELPADTLIAILTPPSDDDDNCDFDNESDASLEEDNDDLEEGRETDKKYMPVTEEEAEAFEERRPWPGQVFYN